MSKKNTPHYLSKIYSLKKSKAIENFQKFFTPSVAFGRNTGKQKDQSEEKDYGYYQNNQSNKEILNTYLFFPTKKLIDSLMMVVEFDTTKVFEVLLAFNTKAEKSDSKTLTPIAKEYDPGFILDLLANTEKLAIKAKIFRENHYKIHIKPSINYMQSTDVRFIKSTMKEGLKFSGLAASYEEGQKYIIIAHPVDKVKSELSSYISATLQNIVISYLFEEKTVASEDLFKVEVIGEPTSPL